MAPTTRRGLLRLAVILMILWNVLLVGSSVEPIMERDSRTRSYLLQTEMDCAKAGASGDCWAVYEKSLSAMLNPFVEFVESLRDTPPAVLFMEVAVAELFPPVAICMLWGALWGIRATVLWVLRGFGVQTGKLGEPGKSVTVMERLREAGGWLVAPKNILAFSAALVALAVSYYFLVSLPASNRERLQFEKDTAAAAKAERTSEEEAALQAERDREQSFQSCSAEAELAYFSYVKLNGKEVSGKPGTYNAPTFVWNTADKRKSDALAECHREYDPKK